MSDKSGYVFTIIDGENKGKKAIAYHKKQEQRFKDLNKFCVTIFDESFQKKEKENVLINAKNLKQIGFSD